MSNTRVLRRLAMLPVHLLLLGFLLWATGAFWYDLPLPPLMRKIAAVLLFSTVGFFWIASRKKGWLIGLGLLAAVTGWWFTLSPSNKRDWLPDVDHTAWADISGDEITFHNIRNCDYRTETDFTPRWETRTVKLSSLTGIDMAINYWGSPYMAHPIISFQFSDAPPLCFSIETRKEKGESYSAIGGIYRQFELIYIVSDERDVMRVRTNYRKGEDVYLYRLTLSPEKARGRLMEYITTLNELHAKPRWYNAVTANCTTSIRTQHTDQRAPWDWRILLNGKADEMLYQQKAFVTGGLDFAELKKRSRVNEAAKAAGDSPDFSKLIRAGLPLVKEEARPPAE